VTSPRLHESIRAIAVFEAVKGALVLAAGFGLLQLLHKDAHRIACEFISSTLKSCTKVSEDIYRFGRPYNGQQVMVLCGPGSDLLSLSVLLRVMVYGRREFGENGWL
jgi:hypothetical protein